MRLFQPYLTFTFRACAFFSWRRDNIEVAIKLEFIESTFSGIFYRRNFGGGSLQVSALKNLDNLQALSERGYCASQRQEAKRATARLDFFCKERPYGSFQRTILLPDRKLDADAMDVKLDKGVLKVTIPKKDSSEVVRAISVCLRRFRPGRCGVSKWPFGN
jgi:Hsp20/alpha crystallin family